MFWVQVFIQVEFWNEHLFLRKNPNIRILYIYIYSAHAQLSIPLHSKGAVFLGIKAAIMRNGFGSWKLTQETVPNLPFVGQKITFLWCYHDITFGTEICPPHTLFCSMNCRKDVWWSISMMIFCDHDILYSFFFGIFSIQIALLHWTTSPRSSEDPSHPKVGAACEPPWLEPLLCPLADCPETQSSESNKLLECKGNDATQTTAFNSSFSMRVCAIAFLFTIFYIQVRAKRSLSNQSKDCMVVGPGNTSQVAL